MTHVLVEVERNIKTAVAKKRNKNNKRLGKTTA